VASIPCRDADTVSWRVFDLADGLEALREGELAWLDRFHNQDFESVLMELASQLPDA
jgi:hypothetical protein